MSNICLSFVFNNQFDSNIVKLNKIYNNRFSTIRYLSPFSMLNDNQVIPIYETSLHFQGYFAQAYSKLPKNCEYYVFCGDDLVLNPKLNENNLIDEFKCHEAAYIKYLNPVWEHSFAWHKLEDCLHFPCQDNQIPTYDYLPKREELLEIYKRHGFEYRNIGFQNLSGVYDKTITLERIMACIHYLLKNGIKRYIHFPLIEGYSDLIIIPQKNLKLFCHLCGIFAAMNLWVDAAVATAMVLSCDDIILEKDLDLHGKEYWNPDEVEKVISKAEKKIDQLNLLFSNDMSYIHPIKLSRFR